MLEGRQSPVLSAIEEAAKAKAAGSAKSFGPVRP
jgi:hypothetical protein